MAWLRRLRFGFVLALPLMLQTCTPAEIIPEGCVVGNLTADGDTCQTIKSKRSDQLYSFFADMNGYALGEEICVCGKAAQMTTCKTGVVIDVMHLDRTCPAPSSKTSQYTFPFD